MPGCADHRHVEIEQRPPGRVPALCASMSFEPGRQIERIGVDPLVCKARVHFE